MRKQKKEELAEQKRIVAKVDELMALCDELEKGLDEAESKRERILGAALRLGSTPLTTGRSGTD